MQLEPQEKKERKKSKVLIFWLLFGAAILSIFGFVLLQIYLYYAKDLPDYKQLEDYNPPTITRVFTSDGILMQELAIERRIYIEYDNIPQLVINAFIAAEDKNFFKHPGVDITSIIRAATQNIMNMKKNSNPIGGSTITQQVIKNFLLTNERTLSRKIKEAILSYRVSRAYSKQKILELYLNEIYLGESAYGIVTAAMYYFNKNLEDLTLEEAALLAALPKAPSTINPRKHYERALERRNWVIDKMRDAGYITVLEAREVKQTPIVLTEHRYADVVSYPFYAEEVRRQLINMYGQEFVYHSGLTVITNIDTKIQDKLDESFAQGLMNYDKQRGFRGAIKNIKLEKNNKNWLEALNKADIPANIEQTNNVIAIILNIKDGNLSIGLKDGSMGMIYKEDMAWTEAAETQENNNNLQLQKGDIILVGKKQIGKDSYQLEQLTEINGGMVAMEPYSGKVLAFSGGYNFAVSSFNRAFQAKRQPGSTFKTFVYLAALEKGYKPNMIVLDSPVSLPQGSGMPAWTPKNYDNNFLGAITLRKALEKSRNIPAVRLVRSVGLPSVVEIAENLGVYHNPPNNYTVALGAFETTVADMTNAFNILASEGQRTSPYLIAAVYDRRGNEIYKGPSTVCRNCTLELAEFSPDTAPRVQFENEQVVDPIANFQITSILQGVVQRGTAKKTSSLNRNIACKTGTTNDSKDTWFICYSPLLTTGLYIGYDNPRSLGKTATGNSVAQPISLPFMEKVYRGADNPEFPVPEGIKFVNVSYASGYPTSTPADGVSIIQEAFRDEHLGISEEDENEYHSSSSSETDNYMLEEPKPKKSEYDYYKDSYYYNKNNNNAEQGFGGLY